MDQYNALPAYDKDQLGPDLEVQIRSIIGSPAALRIEDTITEFDQTRFYNHHHFDKGRFYKRGGNTESNRTEPQSGTAGDQEVPVPEHMMHYGKDQNEKANPSES